MLFSFRFNFRQGLHCTAFRRSSTPRTTPTRRYSTTTLTSKWRLTYIAGDCFTFALLLRSKCKTKVTNEMSHNAPLKRFHATQKVSCQAIKRGLRLIFLSGNSTPISSKRYYHARKKPRGTELRGNRPSPDFSVSIFCNLLLILASNMKQYYHNQS